MDDKITSVRLYRAGVAPNYVWIQVTWEGDNPSVLELSQKPNLDFLIWADVKKQLEKSDPELFGEVNTVVTRALERKSAKRRNIRKKIQKGVKKLPILIHS